MRLHPTATSLLLALAPLVASGQANSEAAQVFEQTSGAVVTINCDQSSGTGFIIDLLPQNQYLNDWNTKLLANFRDIGLVPETYSDDQATLFLKSKSFIVTALHVIDDTEQIQIVFKDKTTILAHTVFGVNENIDLAILVCDIPPPSKPLELANYSETKIGSNAYVIGSPLGVLTSSITSGIVSGKRALDGQDILQYSTPISEGNSGGPIVNNVGQVIGVVTSSIRDTQNINLGIGSPQVKYALINTSERRLPSYFKSNSKALNPTESPSSKESIEVSRKLYTGGASELFNVLLKAYIRWNADFENALVSGQVKYYDGQSQGDIFRQQIKMVTSIPFSANQANLHSGLSSEERSKLFEALTGINLISVDVGFSMSLLAISARYPLATSEEEILSQAEDYYSNHLRLYNSIRSLLPLIGEPASNQFDLESFVEGLHPGVRCFFLTNFKIHPDFASPLDAVCAKTTEKWNIRKGDRIVEIRRAFDGSGTKVSNWEDIWEYLLKDSSATSYTLKINRNGSLHTSVVSFE